MLALGALLMVGSGVVFALSSNYYVLLAAAIFGVISPAGNEIGPFRAIEESTLAHLVHEDARAAMFAHYVILGAIASSSGNFVSGFVVSAIEKSHSTMFAYRFIFWLYAALAGLKFIFSLLLTKHCEPDPEPEEHHPEPDENPREGEEEPLLNNTGRKTKRRWYNVLSKEGLEITIILAALFGLDNFGSGLIPGSLMVYFFTKKFALQASVLGTIFAATYLCGAFSNLVSVRIAKRIGLVKTMVFTHLPSTIFLMLIPFPSVLWLSIVFLVSRTFLATMDQAPKSAFITLVVPAKDRTFIMGIINVVKTLTQSIGPVVTGVLSSYQMFWISFVVAGASKATYDILLLIVFEVKQKKRNQETE